MELITYLKFLFSAFIKPDSENFSCFDIYLAKFMIRDIADVIEIIYSNQRYED